jgi:hypothetical protein
MNLLIVAPVYFPSMDPVRFLTESAERVSLPIHWYGLNKPYQGWWQVQVDDLLVELQDAPASHILYTDARDVIAAKGLWTIERRYAALGSPDLLISTEESGVCAGGWMGTLGAVLDALETLRAMDTDETNPQERWRQAVASGQVEAMIDKGRSIFQVIEHGTEKPTGCLLHFAGGYVDPVYGRAPRMQPYWDLVCA